MILSRYVIDASIGIKLFLREKHSEDVEKLFRSAFHTTEEHLFVPDLFFIECANILWKKIQREGYGVEMARENLLALRTLNLSVIPTSELAERALEIACLHRITAYDACYVALSELTGASLLTADERLRNALGVAFQVEILGS